MTVCEYMQACHSQRYICPHAIADYPNPAKCEISNGICDKAWTECPTYQEYLLKLEN